MTLDVLNVKQEVVSATLSGMFGDSIGVGSSATGLVIDVGGTVVDWTTLLKLQQEAKLLIDDFTTGYFKNPKGVKLSTLLW